MTIGLRIFDSTQISTEKEVNAADVAMPIPTISLSAHGIYALAAFGIFSLLVVTFLFLCIAFECGNENTNNEEYDEEVNKYNSDLMQSLQSI